MFVLSRRINEQLRISQNIILTVIRLRGGKVKLGIECPRKTRVRRSEVTPEVLDAETISPKGKSDGTDYTIL